MKNIDLPILGVKILLRCHEKPISMHDVTQFYKSYSKAERDSVISKLLSDGFLEEKKMPKPNVKKTPTYYFITAAGVKWINNYLEVFSK